MEIPQLRGRAIETTLSHVHPCSFLLPRSQSEYSFMTKYRKFTFFTSKSDAYRWYDLKNQPMVGPAVRVAKSRVVGEMTYCGQQHRPS